jgi:hypothetical protein
VGDEDGGGFQFALEAADEGAHLRAESLVEGGKRLVEQEETGARDESAGEGDALLLAAGQLADLAAGEGFDTGEREHRGERPRRARAF